ncbi:MAG: gamma-glutamylcyclotransferase [Pseudomonadota bacterium]
MRSPGYISRMAEGTEIETAREPLTLAEIDPAAGFWIFAYGSLMWNPGFAAAERRLARLTGYRRTFCMASIVYRGTPEAPGLVLALDRHDGAACSGVAYRIAGGNGAQALAYLRARELVSAAYQEVIEEIETETGDREPALCYVVDPAHRQYRGGLSPGAQAEVIARAAGPAGSNREYLENTVRSLRGLGLEDADLFALADRVRGLP